MLLFLLNNICDLVSTGNVQPGTHCKRARHEHSPEDRLGEGENQGPQETLQETQTAHELQVHRILIF